MKNAIKRDILLLIIIFFSTKNIGFAQKDSNTINIITTDSLKSGNAKDLLTSFFQLAFNNLTGEKKELNFTSNPFALLLKGNPDVAVDTNYYKYRILRKTNFGFGLKLDSSYHFNGFSSQIKYAFVDKRDSTTSAVLFTNLRNKPFTREIHRLNEVLGKKIQQIADIEERKKASQNLRRLMDSVNYSFNKFDTSFRKFVESVVFNPTDSFPEIAYFLKNHSNISLLEKNRADFDSLKNSIKNDLLITGSITDTTYKDQFFFSNLLFKLEILKGIGKQKKGSNWEYNIPISLNLSDDSLRPGRDLKRCIFNFEPGFNWVFRNKSNDQSFFEFKFAGSYRHNFIYLYNEEKRDNLTFNGTFRIRVIDDLWIPLEIKYDPANGNVFGFLSAKLNFTGLGKLLKGAGN